IVVTVDGGGPSGQAGAIRHGISRALQIYNTQLRKRLKKAGLPTRDPRMKESKKKRQRGAPAPFQFSQARFRCPFWSRFRMRQERFRSCLLFSNVKTQRRVHLAVSITMKELLEAGVHFGHQTKRWNPKMKKYIFGKRNGIYIIDLQKTLKLFKEASAFVADLASQGKRVLFVGTKRQAQDAILEEANRCGMFYVNNRWLGGTLTNFATVRRSIERLKELEAILADTEKELSKKERAALDREREKLQKNLIGIREMDSLPDA